MYKLTDEFVKKFYRMIKNRAPKITTKDIVDALGYTPAGLDNNLLIDPIGLGIDYWKFSNCNYERGQIDPLNGRNAIKLIPTGGDGCLETTSINRPMNSIGTKYRFSAWIKADRETQIHIVMRHMMNGFYNQCNLTTEWQEFSVEHIYEEDYPLNYAQCVIGGWATFTEEDPPIYVYCPKLVIVS